MYPDKRLLGTVGDELKDCKMLLYSDADFAGDLAGSKSTSGVLLVMVGPNTLFPFTAVSKAQTSVSHSSTEAEIISLDYSMRSEAIPAMDFWDAIFDSLVDPLPACPPGGRFAARASADTSFSKRRKHRTYNPPHSLRG